MLSVCSNNCTENYKTIQQYLQRITKINLFIDQYKWKEISLPTESKDWKRFEINNKTTTLNVLLSPNSKEEIRQAYISNHTLKCKKQVI